MTEPAPDALVSLRYAADSAGIAVRELERLIAAGRVGRVRRINGTSFINIREVMTYVESLHQQKTDGR